MRGPQVHPQFQTQERAGKHGRGTVPAAWNLPLSGLHDLSVPVHEGEAGSEPAVLPERPSPCIILWEARKTRAIHAGDEASLAGGTAEKKEYVLYFGRFAAGKGDTDPAECLSESCRRFPSVFAGSGPLEAEVSRAENVRNLGFQTGDCLKEADCGSGRQYLSFGVV